jgi:hypothetical protein
MDPSVPMVGRNNFQLRKNQILTDAICVHLSALFLTDGENIASCDKTATPSARNRDDVDKKVLCDKSFRVTLNRIWILIFGFSHGYVAYNRQRHQR